MKVRDRLFMETEDSCAICGVRGEDRLTVHHLDSDRGNNEYDNLVLLCHNCHHQLNNRKGLASRAVEDRKRRLICKTLTQYGLNALKMADRSDDGVVAMPFLLYHVVALGYMEQAEQQMGYGSLTVTARFVVTEKGRRLLSKWKLEDGP